MPSPFTATLSKVLKGGAKLVGENKPVAIGGGVMAGALGTAALMNRSHITPDEVTIQDPLDQTGAGRSGTIARTPFMAPAPEGSTKDIMAQGVSAAEDMGHKALEGGKDLLSRGKQLGREGLDWAAKNPVATGAGVGGAALLAYLLSRKHKAKTAGVPVGPMVAGGMALAGRAGGAVMRGAKGVMDWASSNPIKSTAAASLGLGLHNGDFAPANPAAPVTAPAAPSSAWDQAKEFGSKALEQGREALTTYGTNLKNLDLTTMAGTGVAVGAAGILGAVLMNRHERKSDPVDQPDEA